MEIDEEVSAPQFEKGKAKDSTTAEKKADRQAGIKLPIEIIGRVFDFYYDLVHDGKLFSFL